MPEQRLKGTGKYAVLVEYSFGTRGNKNVHSLHRTERGARTEKEKLVKRFNDNMSHMLPSIGIVPGDAKLGDSIYDPEYRMGNNIPVYSWQPPSNEPWLNVKRMVSR